MKTVIDGLNIGYDDIGSGAPVLFLHGWGVDRHTFDPVTSRISDCCRAVSVDLPGFGESDEPASPLDSDGYADFVERFIAALGLEKPIIVGHSNGGKTAAALVGRGYANCSKLVLISSTGIKPRRKPSFYFNRFKYKLGKKLLASKLFGKAVAKVFDPDKYGSADWRAASPMMKKTMSAVLAQDIGGRFEKIGVPTLLVWGDADTATPIFMAREMEKRIADSGLIVYKNSDHYAFLRNLPAFVGALRYFILN